MRDLILCYWNCVVDPGKKVMKIRHSFMKNYPWFSVTTYKKNPPVLLHGIRIQFEIVKNE